METENPNKDCVFLYTEDCMTCGKIASEYSWCLQEIKDHDLTPITKQISLWIGWRNEAGRIGLKLPFLWNFNLQKGFELSKTQIIKDGKIKEEHIHQEDISSLFSE